MEKTDRAHVVRQWSCKTSQICIIRTRSSNEKKHRYIYRMGAKRRHRVSAIRGELFSYIYRTPSENKYKGQSKNQYG
jgi:hypothetical protein